MKIHFTFTCPSYNELRIDFLNFASQFVVLDNLPNCDKIKIFMTDDRILYKFGVFIRNCYHKRNEFIYL